jgi:hypothetical protein
MDEVAFSETSYGSTKICGVTAHKSPLPEPQIPHPYIAFMILLHLLNSSTEPEIYYTYLHTGQIFFSFFKINIDNNDTLASILSVRITALM